LISFDSSFNQNAPGDFKRSWG